MVVPRIALVAKRQGDKRDYHVYAGDQLVGRIHQTVAAGSQESWFWSVNSLTSDATVGALMHGYASSLDDARAKLRAAFARWLVWAMTIPATDLNHPHLAAELKKIGARAAD